MFLISMEIDKTVDGFTLKNQRERSRVLLRSFYCIFGSPVLMSRSPVSGFFTILYTQHSVSVIVRTGDELRNLQLDRQFLFSVKMRFTVGIKTKL